MIRSYRGVVPRIAASAYVDRSAQVIGDVEVGERSSVWPNVTIRGDTNTIRIGEETSIQDNSVLHCDPGPFRLQIGDRVTVGHQAMLHGCTIGDECLIGIAAVILNGAKIGSGSVIAAPARLCRKAPRSPQEAWLWACPAKSNGRSRRKNASVFASTPSTTSTRRESIGKNRLDQSSEGHQGHPPALQ
jgi:carbonic anhydrase/acetyltransferase-like protein (isoleucine patch superfamily)